MSRPWKYGTILRRRPETIYGVFNGSVLEEQKKRRMMVISDDGETKTGVKAISVSDLTYDHVDDWIVSPVPDKWEPIDEQEP